MADTVDTINAIITGNAAGLTAAMVQGAEVVKVGTEAIATSFETMAAGIETALGPLILITALLEGGELFKEAVEGAAELGKNLEILSAKTGIEAEELSALKYAANLSDVSFEQLSTGLKFLARNMETGAAGFKAMGVETKNSAGELRPMRDVLLDVSARFVTMEDGAGKTALAMNLFGRSGADLIPLLNQGAGGIESLEKKARELGVTMGKDDVEAANKYVDTMKEFKEVMSALGRDLALILMPILTAMAKFLQHIAEAVLFVLNKIKELKQEIQDRLNPAAALDNDPSLVNSLFPKTAAPNFTPDKNATTQLEKWREMWDKLKESQLGGENDLLVMEIFFWKRKLELTEVGSKDYIEVHKHVVDLESQLAERSLRQQKEFLKATEDAWKTAFNQFPKAWDEAVKQWKQGGQSMGDFWRSLMRDLVVEAAGAELKMLEAHAATWLAMKNITVEGVTEQVIASTWSTIKIIANYAYQAAAATWAALAGIPFVGPFLAPIAAAAALAGVLALASGAGGGGGGVSGARSAGSTAAASSSAGGKTNANVTIVAMDAKSFQDWSMNHAATFAAATAAGARAGVRLPTSPGRGG